MHFFAYHLIVMVTMLLGYFIVRTISALRALQLIEELLCEMAVCTMQKPDVKLLVFFDNLYCLQIKNNLRGNLWQKGLHEMF